MSDPKNTDGNGKYEEFRDEKGRFIEGNPGGGRPKGISLLRILKDKLGKTILTDEGEISLADELIERYLKKVYTELDPIAIRDIVDRIDGRPTQTNIIKEDKTADLAEAFRRIADSEDIEDE